MAQENIIAKRYAKGLAEHAREAGQVHEVREDLELLADLLDPHSGAHSIPEFLDFLSTPVVTRKDKLDATDVILKDLGIGKIVSDFLNVLILHGRVALAPNIARAYNQLITEMTHERTAVVHTARQLKDDQKAALAEALSKATGGSVRVMQRVEPGLLGGIRVTIGEVEIDGTVLGRLEWFRQALLKA